VGSTSLTMQKTVLIIEDEPNIIEAISFLLSRQGWNVVTHSDGGNAIERIVFLKPDLIILDVMLPNKSGFDILQEIRSRPAFSELPVLLLTAKGQKRDRQAAEDLGASHFMSKPFANQEILDAVEKLVAS
jgi:DNA-binding response OmpR family regulator